jgi:hypothetical protein
MESNMEAVKAYYDGRVFTPEGPVKLAKNTTVILTFQADGQVAKSPFRITAEEKRIRDEADAAHINANAERLNAETADALRYQVDLF